MSIKIRLDGEPSEVAAAIERLGQVFELAYNGKTTPNDNSFGVRAYMEARERTAGRDTGEPMPRGPVGSADAWLQRSTAEREEKSANFAKLRAQMVRRMDEGRRKAQPAWIDPKPRPTTGRVEPIDLDSQGGAVD